MEFILVGSDFWPTLYIQRRAQLHKITTKNCEQFKLMQLCEKKSYGDPLGLVLKSKASVSMVVSSFLLKMILHRAASENPRTQF